MRQDAPRPAWRMSHHRHAAWKRSSVPVNVVHVAVGKRLVDAVSTSEKDGDSHLTTSTAPAACTQSPRSRRCTAKCHLSSRPPIGHDRLQSFLVDRSVHSVELFAVPARQARRAVEWAYPVVGLF